jgi:hypothetical protein
MREAETDIKFKRKGKKDVSDLSEMKSRKILLRQLSDKSVSLIIFSV